MKRWVLLMVILTCIATVSILGTAGCDEQKNGQLGLSALFQSDQLTDQATSVEVVKEERRINSPLTLEANGPAPDICNEIRYLRFGLTGADPTGKDADMILVLMPGIMAGNNAFDYFAKQLVSKAKSLRKKNLEVWVLDRRTNDLEDVTGVNEAEQKKDVTIAIDYYYHGKEINGKKFAGFLDNKSAPYLSEFGLKMCMEDIYTLIKTNVPDRKDRKKKVFIGGHSLAGFLTALFAGWDFDGNIYTHDDAGYENCAGLVGLDTLLTPNMSGPMMAIFPDWVKNLVGDASVASYQGLVDSLRKGTLPPILPLDTMGFCAETYVALEVAAMQANFDPDGESHLLGTVPLGESVNTVLKLMNSKNYNDFIKKVPIVKDYRFTNEALFGILLDNNFSPVAIQQCSIGFLTGGQISPKYFPIGGNWPYIPFFTEMMGMLIPHDDLFIQDDPGPRENPGSGPLYSWLNFDEIDESVYKCTKPEWEVSNIHDVANCVYSGPSNLMEWYFATRLVVDLMVAPYKGSHKYGLSYMHNEQLAKMPQFLRLAGHGPFIGEAKLSGIDVDPVTAKNYHHFDVLTASMDRDKDAKNIIILPLIDFMIDNVKK